MSNENVVNMVDNLTGGDNVAAQDAFKSALTDKIGDALDAKRQTVANDWLNAADNFEAIDAEAELTGTASASPDAQDEFDAVASQVDAEVEPFEIDDDQVEEE
jgi:hypothetical protein|tara:strand:+ start:231 stop:539 length:309 start_codon:yes stop_codon:yes gene_type:complete